MWVGHANGDVYVLFDEVDHAMGEVEVEGDTGEAGDEVFRHDVEVVRGEAGRGSHAKQSTWRGDIFTKGCFERLDLTQDVHTSFTVRAPRIGQIQGTGRASQELHAEIILERVDVFADDRLRTPPLSCGSGETTGVDHAYKCFHREQTIHCSRIVYNMLHIQPIVYAYGRRQDRLMANTQSDTTFRSDIAFTPAVKAAQEARGSRKGYANAMMRHDWADRVTPVLKDFIAERDSFYLATASADGQPYIQHRGGPKGFLKVLDERRLAFADYRGNRQYISVGNLNENNKAFIFMMDYPNRQRIKVWGRAEYVEGDSEILRQVADPDYDAKLERAIVFHIDAWDTNCPQHITPRYTVEQLTEHGFQNPQAPT